MKGRALYSVRNMFENLAAVASVEFAATNRAQSAANNHLSSHSMETLAKLDCQLTAANFAVASALRNIWSSAGRSNSFPPKNTSEIFVVL